MHADVRTMIQTRAPLQLSYQGPSFRQSLLMISLVLALSCGKHFRAEAQSSTANRQPTSAPASRPVDLDAQSVWVIETKDSQHPKSLVDKLAARYDPRLDGWNTEVLSRSTATQLKTLISFIKSPEAIGEPALAQLLAADFGCTPLGGLPLEKLHEIFNDGILRVHRLETAAPAKPLIQVESYQGISGLRNAIRQIVKGLGASNDIYAKTKIFKITPGKASFTTHVYFEASNRASDQSAQYYATWKCRWTYPQNEEEKPRLQRIDLDQYEQATISTTGGQLFTDCTESAMGQDPSYSLQVLPGINDWLSRISVLLNITWYGHHGLAIGDVNSDGLEDLYVCDTGGLPNRLYLQRPDGTVSDDSAKAQVDWLENSRAALLIDLDNDGDQDLVVATIPLILFAENDGTGRFTLRDTSDAVADAHSMCAADYDEDGDLDIYICGYRPSPETGKAGIPLGTPYYDANNGGTNALLENQGEFQFLDVTDQTGVNRNNTRFSYAAAWNDYDGDGDLDLYVANDFGRNNLYRNDEGHFTDVAATAGVEDIASGMSAVWGDYNRDGLADIYIGNMFSGAGGRVTFQRRFSEGQSDQTVPHLQRMARGNTLFENLGDGSFRDVSQLAAVTMGRWAWASKFADVNNDGWTDLLVANGYFTNEDSGDL